MNRSIERLFAEHPQIAPLRDRVFAAAELLERCVRSGGKILIAGNGGSAADADHISGELLKGFLLPRRLNAADLARYSAAIGEEAKALQYGIPAIPLPALSAAMTAYLNDEDPAAVYAQLVFALGAPGDLLIAISTSGNSQNILSAAKVAHEKGMTVLALTGRDGGALAGCADVALIAPAQQTYRIQEYHLPIYHALCAELEERLFGE